MTLVVEVDRLATAKSDPDDVLPPGAFEGEHLRVLKAKPDPDDVLAPDWNRKPAPVKIGLIEP
jgi:hypothetical protein